MLFIDHTVFNHFISKIGFTQKFILPYIFVHYSHINTCTVEPIFKDISNSDNCCYHDRFANPSLFLSLSHVIYFCNYEYKKIAFLCYNDYLVRKFRGKTERNAKRYCMRKRSQTFRLAVPS